LGGVASVVAASKRNDVKVLVLKSTGMSQSRNMPNYAEHFKKKSWIEAGKKINIPTLILHGKKDEMVEIELGEALHNAIKNSKMIILDEADHRFSRKEDFDKSIREISEFIVKHI
jgi:dipeptidyl aminopeptidase/acylaminoacyl peptidase